jgi:hypothetical protein
VTDSVTTICTYLERAKARIIHTEQNGRTLIKMDCNATPARSCIAEIPTDRNSAYILSVLRSRRSTTRIVADINPSEINIGTSLIRKSRVRSIHKILYDEKMQKQLRSTYMYDRARILLSV